MSHKNNVNPDHYKLAGRDRPNETVVAEEEKQKYSQAQAGSDQERQNFIPGAAPGNKSNDASRKAEGSEPADQEGGIEQADEASKSSSID
jgi:hypothetical protein